MWHKMASVFGHNDEETVGSCSHDVYFDDYDYDDYSHYSHSPEVVDSMCCDAGNFFDLLWKENCCKHVISEMR